MDEQGRCAVNPDSAVFADVLSEFLDL